ncbi:MAG: acetylglutamate kinase [bacterium]|nr:acetylglutamate kinase [bacterium]
MTDKKQYYFSKFQDAIFVIKMGGEVIFDDEKLLRLLQDIATLHEHGIKIILVHGGGPQADTLSRSLGFEPVKVEGRRVTSEQDIEVVQMLYGGKLNLRIISLFRKLGVKAMRVSGMDAQLLDVVKRPVGEVDYGLVGDIVQVNPEILYDLLGANIVPVVSPLAASEDGEILNINADTIAAHLAEKIMADKLIYFTNTDGVLNDQGERYPFLVPEEVTELTAKGVINGGMKVKTQNGLQALQGGVKRVHILNGLHEHSLLLEVVTTEGSGTMLCTAAERDEHLKELS